MTQPNPPQVDERLLAVLVNARQRDAGVLRNADHLASLLADLAPDMPIGLRNACVAVARTNATSWLTQTPPYSVDQVVEWLRAQFPELIPDATRQAIAAFVSLNSAPPSVPVPPSAPVPPQAASPIEQFPTVVATSSPTPSIFDKQTEMGAPPTSQPVISQPTVMPPTPPTDVTAVFAPPPFQPQTPPPFGAPPFQPQTPPGQQPWPPAPSAQPRRSSKVPLIVALVLVLAGAGAGAFFLFANSDKDPDKSAGRSGVPTNVPTDVKTSGPTSEGPTAPNPPASLTVSEKFYSLRLTWSAVDGADSYQVRDSQDPSWTPPNVHGTSYVVEDASLTSHEFDVRAVRDGELSTGTTVEFAPSYSLSDAELELGYQLPASYVVPGSCSSITDSAIQKKYVDAALACDPVGARAHRPSNLYVIQLKSGTQNTYESKRFTGMIHRDGCAVGSNYPERGVHGQWTVDHKPFGDTYCWVVGKYSVFVWTYYKENIVFEANGKAPTTRTGLYNWWYGKTAYLR